MKCIEIAKISESKMEGRLVKTSPSISLDKETGAVKVNEDISSLGFELKFGEANIVTVFPGVSLYTAREITIALNNIGFKNLILYFNDQSFPLADLLK